MESTFNIIYIIIRYTLYFSVICSVYVHLYAVFMYIYMQYLCTSICSVYVHLYAVCTLSCVNGGTINMTVCSCECTGNFNGIMCESENTNCLKLLYIIAVMDSLL